MGLRNNVIMKEGYKENRELNIKTATSEIY